MAKTYGLLPSEVVQRATAYDIMITDVLMTWETHQRNPNDPELYDENQLQTLMDGVK